MTIHGAKYPAGCWSGSKKRKEQSLLLSGLEPSEAWFDTGHYGTNSFTGVVGLITEQQFDSKAIYLMTEICNSQRAEFDAYNLPTEISLSFYICS